MLQAPSFDQVINISLTKAYINTNFKGLIKSPSGLGKKGLNLTFLTIPSTTQVNLTTGADGSWSVIDNEMLMHQNYSIEI